MRPLAELISDDLSAWTEIAAAVGGSPFPVEVLPADPDRAADCLLRLQVTTGSWLGALVYASGGLVVDDGWLRVFGSGDPGRGLPDLHEINLDHDGDGIVVAQDVLGGQFAWRSSGDGPPTIHYFAPDSVRWEDIGLGYTDWLAGMLTGAFDRFYASMRWPGWADEVAALRLDEGIATTPELRHAEGRQPARLSRRPVPMVELTRALTGAGH